MSLFTRLIGLDSPTISIHRFHALIDESKQSRINGSDAADILSLDVYEKNHAQTIIVTLNTEKQYRRFFNYLCLGQEGVVTPYDYTDEDLFWTALGTF